VGTANVSLVTHYARIAGVSPSVCLSVTILTSFISALMFYLIYKEVLNVRHWMGMISIMLGVFTIGLSKSSGETNSSEGNINSEIDNNSHFQHLIKIVIPISIAFGNCILYTMAALITRFAQTRGYPKIKFAIDLTGMAGLFYLTGYTFCQLFVDLKFTLNVTLWMTFAGCFCYTAFLFQVYAIASGKGAIVQAIANTQCVF
jgi:drug/metabolite transporter (DMT)-like permease